MSQRLYLSFLNASATTFEGTLIRTKASFECFVTGSVMSKFCSFGTLLSCALLSACAGSGGGSSATPTATVAPTFTKFSALAADVPTTISGSSQESTYAWNSGTDKITAVGTASNFAPTATAEFTVDSSLNPKVITFTSAGGTSATFSSAAGDTIGMLVADNNVGAAITKAGDKILLFARSGAIGWDYQTFGIWATGAGSGSGTAGAFSVGTLTSGVNIPTTGTATYTGSAGGRYVDASGNYYFTVANASAVTDFAARTIAFSTSATQQSKTLVTGTFAANTNLNTTGTLTYTAATNQFTGAVSTVGGGAGNAAMTGTATGNFYGPTAQEIGGGFAAKGTGTAVYSGAFGGKR
jgi:hypothetical protein